MERVTGIGGIFFKSDDPNKLHAWYKDHLGFESPAPPPITTFDWRDKDDPDQIGYTVWSPFPKDTEYFKPSSASFMINFRVADLDAMLAQLRANGVEVDERVEECEFGRFGWAMDPEGNRVELWEPPKAQE